MSKRPFRASYRIQFTPDFSFTDAAALSGYLKLLGISHLYASPVTEARDGSSHGYDGVDPTVFRAAFGGEREFRAMAAKLRQAGIGIVLDIVPNHMAVDAANPYWMDVLEFGANARSAGVFDIDWSRRLVLPWPLKDSGTLDGVHVDADTGRLLAAAGWGDAPLRPRSVAAILDKFGGAGGLAQVWRALEGDTPSDAAIAFAHDGLRQLDADNPEAIARAFAELDPQALHDDQHWRVVAGDPSPHLTYRRFFEISHLIGVRIEDEAVFELVHRLPLALLKEGLIDGLRIDHIDGLVDPAGYCRRLREATGPDAVILIEKILGRDEALRPWPIQGTTGYERLNAINEAFVDAAGLEVLRHYLATTGMLTGDPAARVFAAKTEVLRLSFMPEIEALTRAAAAVVPASDHFGETLIAMVAAFPTYRSYIDKPPAGPTDHALWKKALARAAEHADIDTERAEKLATAAAYDEGPAAAEFRRRFQQLTGPAMAKGVEDTELYRNVALASLNEVGADLSEPLRSMTELDEVFAAYAPTGQIPLATHDTKRGADTRARLNLLSWHPREWISQFERWQAYHAPLKTRVGDALAPDALDEWLIYQTLFGAWPISADRLETYLVKAMREAKRHTSWIGIDDTYEAAVLGFAHALLSSGETEIFRREMAAFVAATMRASAVNSLAQTVLQLTLPGVPDIYQGTEFYDFSLVDPDNRRPVKGWDVRMQMAQEAIRPALSEPHGSAKLHAIQMILGLRRQSPALFEGNYRPIAVDDRHWHAFSRTSASGEIRVAVPLRPVTDATALRFADPPADGRWRRVLPDSGEILIQDGFVEIDTDWPVIVLVRDSQA